MGRDYFICLHQKNLRCVNYASGAYRKEQREAWRQECEQFFAALDAGKPVEALHMPRRENPCSSGCTNRGNCAYCMNKGLSCQFCIRNQLRLNTD